MKLSLPILLLAVHVYSPVSSLDAFVIVKFAITLPSLVRIFSLIDTPSIEGTSTLCHITLGIG